MSSAAENMPCAQGELVSAYALHALSPSESLALEEHVSACSDCRQALTALRPIIESFAFWPIDVLRPAASKALWARLAQRVAAEGDQPIPAALRQGREPEWEQVAPGISCKLLATDRDSHRVSMLVRLAAGAEYPPHRHAGVEELHLLHGELFIDDRRLHAGDYNRAEPGSADKRVWSATGCTCVLITSTADVIG